MGFMTKPFMGLWNGNSELARKLDVIDWKYEKSYGDNNYNDAPLDEYY